MTRNEELNLGCVVQGAASYTSKQGSVYAPGISAETAGSKAVFLGMVTIPPEGRTKDLRINRGIKPLFINDLCSPSLAMFRYRSPGLSRTHSTALRT